MDQFQTIKSDLVSLIDRSGLKIMSVEILLREYEKCMGCALPFEEVGYPDAIALLMQMQDVITITERNNQFMIQALSDDSKHVSNFMDEQTKTHYGFERKAENNYPCQGDTNKTTSAFNPQESSLFVNNSSYEEPIKVVALKEINNFNTVPLSEQTIMDNQTRPLAQETEPSIPKEIKIEVSSITKLRPRSKASSSISKCSRLASSTKSVLSLIKPLPLEVSPITKSIPRSKASSSSSKCSRLAPSTKSVLSLIKPLPRMSENNDLCQGDTNKTTSPFNPQESSSLVNNSSDEESNNVATLKAIENINSDTLSEQIIMDNQTTSLAQETAPSMPIKIKNEVSPITISRPRSNASSSTSQCSSLASSTKSVHSAIKLVPHMSENNDVCQGDTNKTTSPFNPQESSLLVNNGSDEESNKVATLKAIENINSDTLSEQIIMDNQTTSLAQETAPSMPKEIKNEVSPITISRPRSNASSSTSQCSSLASSTKSVHSAIKLVPRMPENNDLCQGDTNKTTSPFNPQESSLLVNNGSDEESNKVATLKAIENINSDTLSEQIIMDNQTTSLAQETAPSMPKEIKNEVSPITISRPRSNASSSTSQCSSLASSTKSVHSAIKLVPRMPENNDLCQGDTNKTTSPFNPQESSLLVNNGSDEESNKVATLKAIENINSDTLSEQIIMDNQTTSLAQETAPSMPKEIKNEVSPITISRPRSNASSSTSQCSSLASSTKSVHSAIKLVPRIPENNDLCHGDTNKSTSTFNPQVSSSLVNNSSDEESNEIITLEAFTSKLVSLSKSLRSVTKFALPTIDVELVTKLRQILEAHPEGITTVDFFKEFEARFKECFDPQKFGFVSVATFLISLSDIFRVKTINSEWTLFDARMNTKAEKTSKKPCIPSIVLDNLALISQEYPDGINGHEIINIYEERFGHNLNLNLLGFENINIFLMECSSINVVMDDEKCTVFPKNWGAPKKSIEKTDALPILRDYSLNAVIDDEECPRLPKIWGAPKKSIEKTDALPILGDYSINAVMDDEECTVSPKNCGVRIQQTDALPVILGDYMEVIWRTFFRDDVCGPDAQFKKIDLTDLNLTSVTICDVFAPDKFWVHITDNITHLNHLMSNLRDFYDENEENHCIGEMFVKENLVCATKWSDDWHRALITKKINLDVAEVFFVDYGTVSIVPIKEIRVLHKQFLYYPIYAICSSLRGIAPLNLEEGYTDESAEFLSANYLGKCLRVTWSKVNLIDPVLELVLIDATQEKEESISSALIKAGYATEMESDPTLKKVFLDKASYVASFYKFLPYWMYKMEDSEDDKECAEMNVECAVEGLDILNDQSENNKEFEEIDPDDACCMLHYFRAKFRQNPRRVIEHWNHIVRPYQPQIENHIMQHWYHDLCPSASTELDVDSLQFFCDSDDESLEHPYLSSVYIIEERETEKQGTEVASTSKQNETQPEEQKKNHIFPIDETHSDEEIESLLKKIRNLRSMCNVDE